MQIIDSHCHLGGGIKNKVNIKELLRNMDKAKVGKAIICPIEQFLAIKNREGNDLMIKAVKKYPDRLIGFGAVNPWHLGKAKEEIKRFLDNGLRGVKFHSVLQGFSLVDPILSPLLRVIDDFKVIVYVHTGTPILAMPFQLSHLAEKYPDIKFVMGHGAFSDFWYDVIPSLRPVPNITVETSYIDGGTIKNIVSEVGANRICFGSDFPYSSLEIEIGKIKNLNLEKKDESLIFQGTITKLLEK